MTKNSNQGNNGDRDNKSLLKPQVSRMDQVLQFLLADKMI